MKVSVALNIILSVVVVFLLVSKNEDVSPVDTQVSADKELGRVNDLIAEGRSRALPEIEAPAAPQPVLASEPPVASTPYESTEFTNPDTPDDILEIYNSDGVNVAEFRKDENAVYFKDGIYIKEQNKLLLTSPGEISQGMTSTWRGKRENISVLNNTGEKMYAFWIDWKGNPVWKGEVEAGESWRQYTRQGHPFTFTDSQGNVLGTVTPDGQGQQYQLD